MKRSDLALACLPGLVLMVLAGLRLYPDACGLTHDDAIYVLTAKELAEGDGYRLTNLPGEPPQTKYPILYPALLALVWKAWPDFPDNLIALKGVTLLCGAVFLALAYLYLVRFDYASRPVALASTMLCAVSLMFGYCATMTIAEMPFALLLVGALWWLEVACRASPPPHPQPLSPEAGQRGASAAREFLGGVLLALPYLCRSVGAVVVPVGLLLLWRAGRRLRWTALGSAAAVLPWLAWSSAAARSWSDDPILGYYTDYLGWWFSCGISGILRVADQNWRWVAAGIPTMTLERLSERLLSPELSRLWYPFYLGLGVLALGMLLRDMARGRALPSVLAAYLALVIAWPWLPHRFLVPVLPFLAVYLFRGLALPWRSPGLRPVGWAALGLFVLIGAAWYPALIKARYERDTPLPELEDGHSWEGNRRLFAWIEANTDPDDVLAAGADTTMSLYTGRRSFYPVLYPPLAVYYGLPSPDDRVMELAERALDGWRPRFLVLTPNFHGEDYFRRWFDAWQRRHPGRAVLRYRDPDDPRFEVFELGPPEGR